MEHLTHSSEGESTFLLRLSIDALSGHWSNEKMIVNGELKAILNKSIQAKKGTCLDRLTKDTKLLS
jgi:hypothetical protein